MFDRRARERCRCDRASRRRKGRLRVAGPGRCSVAVGDRCTVVRCPAHKHDRSGAFVPCRQEKLRKPGMPGNTLPCRVLAFVANGEGIASITQLTADHGHSAVARAIAGKQAIACLQLQRNGVSDRYDRFYYVVIKRVIILFHNYVVTPGVSE